MKLSLSLRLFSGTSVWAWVPPVSVRPKTNAVMTPEELTELYHLKEAAEMIRTNAQAQPPLLSNEERQQLWQRNASPLLQRHDETLVSPVLTSDERAQLFHLDRQSPVDTKHHQLYTSQDREALWKLQERASMIKDTVVNEPYTSQDRADLWGLGHENPYMQQSHRLLSFQELERLWHLDKMVVDKTEEHPYITKHLDDNDRKLLWHLEEQGKALHDATKAEVFSDQDRSSLWHLEEQAKVHHDETKREVYSDEDRARLWHLVDERTVPKDDPSFVSDA